MARPKAKEAGFDIDLSALSPVQLTALARDIARITKKAAGGIASDHPEVARVATEVRNAATTLKVTKLAFLVALGKHLKLGLIAKERKPRGPNVAKPAAKSKTKNSTVPKKVKKPVA
jgi:hypothetical protein